MPHVIVKLWPGKSEKQKTRLSEAIVKDVMNVLNYGEESVSVATLTGGYATATRSYGVRHFRRLVDVRDLLRAVTLQ
jgi:hypothetical protein